MAFDGTGAVRAEKVVKTAGAPSALWVEPEIPWVAQSRPGEIPELAWFRIRVVDKDGNVCPQADSRIDVRVSGSARFWGICNGDATSLESFVQPTMKAFHGELVVTVEAGREAGHCRVHAVSEGLKAAWSEIQVRQTEQ